MSVRLGAAATVGAVGLTVGAVRPRGTTEPGRVDAGPADGARIEARRHTMRSAGPRRDRRAG